ncbi:MAG: helix-turn-helix domain-containing protein [Acidimicrobiales bacterium]
MAKDDRFLTVQEVAEQMRVSNMTVYRLIKAGELVAARVGRSYRLREAEVESYLRRGDS